MSAVSTLLSGLGAEHRERLADLGHEVTFPAQARLFNEGQHADRFWIVREGAVALDLHVPGRHPAVIETLGQGRLVGVSWLIAPYVWQLGATALRRVSAAEFDAVAVRDRCLGDPDLAAAVALWAAQVLHRRLHASRMRLLDLYGPAGSGPLR